MNSNEKPFPCKIEGCKLSFVTEDRLNVHQKKHDMLLNLEIPNKSNLFADQTPTPTRLIGKCEEVGLFEDLQHVNPFDETFRRAVEEKSTGVVEKEGQNTPAVAVGRGDDTLHTPHVFPLLERRESIKQKNNNLSKLVISRSSSRKEETLASDGDVRDVTSQSIQSNILETIHKRKIQQQHHSSKRKGNTFVKILPKTAPTPQSVINPRTESNKPSLDINNMNTAKIKLKEHLVKNVAATGRANETVTVKPMVVHETELICRVPKELKSSVETNQVQNNEKEKLQKHERWKAAAKRYRTRVKQSQNILHRKNIELEEENHRLKTEIFRLKNALSLHKDCSVTRALLLQSSSHVSGSSKSDKSRIVIQEQQHTMFVNIPKRRPATTEIVDRHVIDRGPVYIIVDGTGVVESADTGIRFAKHV
ncbi:cyclic AMP-dependent transcription factor ATF-2 [Toxorhynchites rutilus septentrionalis]|uniref:cyclic AMP-dependent transcription factor ATF-2 n=1 Tax=Toxorhynchites rutilus septentrionalis TaxID=329112 RepID=UPI00247A361E|nr:cyclic AMP-dependent transcription factor ATF-2 [Toxorhynchites rutilus septentrionalis]